MARIVDTGWHDGVPVHYLDAVVFRAGESYLTLGTVTDEPGPVSNYTGQLARREARRQGQRRCALATMVVGLSGAVPRNRLGGEKRSTVAHLAAGCRSTAAPGDRRRRHLLGQHDRREFHPDVGAPGPDDAA